jgi:hypothetical protein
VAVVQPGDQAVRAVCASELELQDAATAGIFAPDSAWMIREGSVLALPAARWLVEVRGFPDRPVSHRYG